MRCRPLPSLFALLGIAASVAGCSDAEPAVTSLAEVRFTSPSPELVLDGVTRAPTEPAPAAARPSPAQAPAEPAAAVEPPPITATPVALATGSRHSCALDPTGEVFCWGVGGSGGYGGTPSALPDPNWDTASAVAAGELYTCATLGPDRHVWCWGRRYVGGGDGYTWDEPEHIPTPHSVVQIDAHEHLFCGRTELGQVWCWELDAPKDAARIYTPEAVDLAVGYGHACSLDADGRPWCWGLAQWGGLGPGWDFQYGIDPVEPMTPTELDGFVDISAGRYHTCAVHQDGKVWCWGWDVSGQLGRGFDPATHDGWSANTPFALAPEPVLGLDDAVAVAVGGQHTCAVRASGELYCWGSDSYGQLGRGEPGGADGTPRGVPGLGPVLSVAAGNMHTCAQRTTGEVVCWGFNGGGQIGAGVSGDKPAPDSEVLVPLTTDLSAGGHHSCAVDPSGGAWCWGDASSGRLGDGSTDRQRLPVRVQDVGSAWQQVSAGYFNTCGVTNDAEMWCWGRNTFGLDAPEPMLAPVHIAGLEDVVAVDAGVVHACARTGDGRVWCFGGNDDYQLGDGSTVNDPTPRPVPGVAGTTWLEVGSELSCAGDDEGHAWCWGRGPDASGEAVIWPVPALWDGDVRRIEISNSVTCAIDMAGSVTCLGWNGLCQVGGSTPNVFGAGLPEVLGPVVDLALGSHHACALHDDGTTTCWGSNLSGVLGTGSDAGKTCTPEPGPTLPGAVELELGSDHSCARLEDGRITCWGSNSYAQLGDGDGWFATPTPVLGLEL